mgnify:FL=1
MDEKEKQKMREDEIAQMVTSFCKERLDAEYEQLCEKMVRKLGRKRNKPLLTGRTEIWAAAVVYTVGTMNFLFDKSFEPYVSSADINEHFGTSSSTVAQKARTIRQLLKLSQYWDKDFSTKHMQESNPMNMLMDLSKFF